MKLSDLLENNSYLVTILISLLVFVIGIFLIKIANNKIRMFAKRHGHEKLAADFLTNLLSFFLVLILLIFTLNLLGIYSGSLLALLGSAGFTVGFAIKDYLSNLIGGVALIITKPFKEGDSIETCGISGTVKTIGLYNTKVKSDSGYIIFIPNTKLMADKIINKSL